MQFFAKFPLKYAIFSYFLFTIFDFCNFSSFFANFSHFFWKYPNFGLKFSGSFRISKTTHKTGFGKIRIFQKNIHPCLEEIQQRSKWTSSSDLWDLLMKVFRSSLLIVISVSPGRIYDWHLTTQTQICR